MAKKNVSAKAVTGTAAQKTTEKTVFTGNSRFMETKGFLDQRINKEVFETKVSFETGYNPKTGKSWFVVTFGENLDKQIQVFGRGGNGVTALTNFEGFFKAAGEKAAVSELLNKEAKKI